jgi:glyoxylase-like metal-dependent hydrolase (beta-lactamase superfamily II)
VRWIRLESALWETSSLLLIDGDRAVAVDPGVRPKEIEAIAARAHDEGAAVEDVLATHSDWDHVAGIAAFPDSRASMGPAAAERVAGGDARREMDEEGAKLGLAWDGEPRVDRILEPGRATEAGSFVVETLPAPGHTDCGLAYRIRTLDLLAVGDYLSPREFPFIFDSTAAYRGTLALFLDTLRRDPPATVVPGHGRPLSAAEAIAIADADLRYLNALRRSPAARRPTRRSRSAQRSSHRGGRRTTRASCAATPSSSSPSSSRPPAENRLRAPLRGAPARGGTGAALRGSRRPSHAPGGGRRRSHRR